jgi:hypothetical protein
MSFISFNVHPEHPQGWVMLKHIAHPPFPKMGLVLVFHLSNDSLRQNHSLQSNTLSEFIMNKTPYWKL